MVPDRAACLKALSEDRVPPHIIAHSVKVAEVALRIALALNRAAGEALDLALLEAGALLHDVKKPHTIQNGGDHALLGGERATELGFAELAPLIARHVDLGEWSTEGPVTESELLNYADKRIRHEELVSLDERFADLLERYGKHERARERIRLHWDTMRAVERKIFSRLPFGPEGV